jgi:nucleoid DNA-binding protein
MPGSFLTKLGFARILHPKHVGRVADSWKVSAILRRFRNISVNITVVSGFQAEFSNTIRAAESGRIDMSKPMTKSELIGQIAEHSELKKSDVKGVIETLATIGYKELKKNGSFLVPGFAKFVVIKKPATKERAGVNPFTKEPTVFKARPARKIIRARPVKAAKDAV